MGDEEDRAGIGLEVLLQPADRVDVEVVGRLVEQQQVRLRHQRAAEQRAATPAAGQLAHLTIRGKREPRHDELHFLLEPPPVALLERVLQVPESLEIRGGVRFSNACRRLVVFRDEAAERAEAVRHFGKHRTLPHHRDILVQPRDAQTRLAPDRAGIHGLIPGQDAEQAALPGTIASDEGDALAVVDLKVGVFEERQMPEREADALQRQKRHRGQNRRRARTAQIACARRRRS